jgi:glycosyltransferase involved in cell wall biosynthesis
MAGVIFVGMIPPESHNPEEGRFVEELATHVPRLRYLRGIGIKGLRLHQLRSLPSRIGALGGPGKGGGLLILPFRTGPARHLNVRWVRRQLLRLTDGQPNDWMLWTRFPSPELVEAVDSLPFAGIVYEPIDSYAAAEYLSVAERHRIVQAETDLVRRASVVAGSLALAERFRDAGGGSQWIPFGHDLNRRCGGEGIREPVGRPRLCVVGGFDWRMDESLLYALARRRPEWQLILAGPRRRPWGDHLIRLSNVHWLGRITADRVRSVIADCDVTLIPYRLTEWTNACVPVKVFEYLAESKPVIATPLPELNLFRDVLTLVLPQQFETAIAQTLRETGQVIAERRREAASRFTLQARARRAGELLRERVELAATG